MDQLLFAFNVTSINRELFDVLSSDCVSQLFQTENSSSGNISLECLQSFFNHSGMLSNEFNFTLESGNSTSEGESRKWILDVWIQLFWTLIFGVMVLIAIIGNLTVMAIVLSHKKMRSVTNFFLLNLSIADLATAVFNAIFNFVF